MSLDQLSPAAIPDTRRRQAVAGILRAALAAADPAAAVRSALHRSGDRLVIAGQTYDLSQYRRVAVVGMGKAAVNMARGLLDVLSDRVETGVLVPKHMPSAEDEALPGGIRLLAGQHPLPGPGSIAAAGALVELLSGCCERDLVFCLISGGGSALVALPHEGVTLDALQQLTGQLLASGASINEVNILRRHLDRIKGGGLARLAHPAALVTFILSDVIGSPLSDIASGPTAADPTTFADALAVLDRYGLRKTAPLEVVSALEQGAAGNLPETLKPSDPLLEQVQNVLVASNYQSASAAAAQARASGFHAALLTTYLDGEARGAGRLLAGILRQAALTGDPLPRPCCLVAGGETTVTLRGAGLGGRNQELALSAAVALDGLEDVALVTLATDGEDGPTAAAGAVANGKTLQRARSAGLDPQRALQRNDSYTFFQSLGDLVVTGPTGTNVNDLAFLFAF